MHTCPWGEATEVTPGFIVRKVLGDFREAELPEEADVVYYDAFSPRCNRICGRRRCWDGFTRRYAQGECW